MELFSYIMIPVKGHLDPSDIRLNNKLYHSYDEALEAAAREYGKKFYIEENEEGLTISFNKNLRTMPIAYVTIIPFKVK